ncbi:hypothetical protein [Cellulomonas fengjieae]|uniref:Lipoprotein n=1 Tax=Cellulomonas fengjieae TaxID=2819978 RepID=A0ABS3SM96_9CELL|nr:hypothetical protein [Cellulomonas fengjieae]MBO3086609.1 hypothetical protein [Cellulomonas fengjieae]QVI66542.1 hypothetical protein KG102_02735 [Cellulomonas fengjieae]
MRRAAVVVGTALSIAVLAGCSTQEADPPAPTSSATAAPSPTPTPTPSPSGIVEGSDLELGIVLDDVPELGGDDAQVYNWAATYEKEYWRTLTTNAISPAMSLLASPELQQRVTTLVQSNVADKWVIDGTMHVRIDSIVVDGDTASAAVCRDFSDTTATEDGRALTPEELGPDLVPKQMTLARVAGEQRWTVLTSETGAGTC